MILHLLSLLLSVLLIVGCSQNPQPLGKPVPDITYTHLQPYSVRGGSVAVRQSYVPTATEQQVIDNFVIAPDILLKRYAQNRFITAGKPMHLSFDIKKASLKKTVHRAAGVENLFGGGEDIYQAHIIVLLTPTKISGLNPRPYIIELHKTLFLSHNLSLAETEFRQFEFLETVMEDIDRGVIKIITGKFQ